MISTASVALAMTGSFPSRLAVTLLVLLDGTMRTQTVDPVVAALVPVAVAFAPFVWALFLAGVVLAFALALAIGTVLGHVTISFAG